jgi:hypothetical protein
MSLNIDTVKSFEVQSCVASKFVGFKFSLFKVFLSLVTSDYLACRLYMRDFFYINMYFFELGFQPCAILCASEGLGGG